MILFCRGRIHPPRVIWLISFGGFDKSNPYLLLCSIPIHYPLFSILAPSSWLLDSSRDTRYEIRNYGSPRICISRFNSILKVFLTLFSISSIKYKTSLAVAFPLFIIKLACLFDIAAFP